MLLDGESLKVASAVAGLALAAACVGCSSGGMGTMPGGGQGSPASGGAASSGNGSGSGSDSGASSGSNNPPPTTVSSGTTWANGQSLSASVTIPAGVTVTIAPGATIQVASGVVIDVAGTLTASSAGGTHALLTGSGWKGISVANGGTLSLDGVDVTGASTGIATLAGAASAEYDDGTITGATTPFNVAKGTTLTTKNAAVTGTLGTSRVAGSFVATYLDYDSNGNEGITTTDPTATESIENSKLHGPGPVADMLVSATGCASLHVAHTDITDVHCAFHFDTITAFDISYTNAENNAYGFMLYGSGGAGTRSVTYSNIAQNGTAFDTEGTNGPITFDHDYITGTQTPGDAVSVTNPQPSTVDAGAPLQVP